jgi:hypothetical protein
VSRRVMAWLTALAGTALAVLVIVFWKILFGPGTWGSGGNLFAWVLCGGLSFLWLNVLQKERHIQAMTQAREHHEAMTQQAEDHHRAMKAHVASMMAAQDGGE